MSQICTTIEQSKRLMIAGVKRQTADMSHRARRAIAFEKDENGRWWPQKGTPVNLIASKPSCELDVPAWSLSALWDLLAESNITLEYATNKPSEVLIEYLVTMIERFAKQGRI